MPETLEEPEDASFDLSKTQRKKDMHALQELGAALLKLSPQQLGELDLPDSLIDALHEARRIKSREALRRQMQYIGRLMRQVDPGPIQARLDAWRGQAAQEIARQHRLEQWRDRLIADDAALTELAAAHAGLDLPALRSLIRNARREAERNKPPKSARALFRALREWLPEDAPPPMDKL